MSDKGKCPDIGKLMDAALGERVPCYASFWPGQDEVILDGAFDAEQLRWLADYMDAHKEGNQP